VTRRIAALAILLLLAVCSVCAQPSVPQFSADMRINNPKLGHEAQGKLYFGGNRFRMDMTAQGHESVVITDMASKVTYLLMPQQQMYMEMRPEMVRTRTPDFKLYDPEDPCANVPDTNCAKVGTETVNGRTCDKWQFTSTKGVGETRTVWIDQKTRIPVKTVNADGTVFELTNIKEGPQPASLFGIPAGYQKMDLGGMMGGRAPR
jgi:outer membrane lipoprotein-sorting protein